MLNQFIFKQCLQKVGKRNAYKSMLNCYEFNHLRKIT